MKYNSQKLLAQEYKALESELLDMNVTMEQKIESMDIAYLQNMFPITAKCWDEEIRAGHSTLFVYHPDKEDSETMPLIYFIHGGGFISGNANQSSAEMKRIANIHHAIVVSVEYRLATTAPFPAAIDDAYNGLKYCLDHASQLGIDSTRIAVMGESAGGGIAAALSIYNREHDNIPLKGQILIYPMLDYRTGSDSSLYNNSYTGEIGWTRKMNRLCWDAYRGDKEILKKDMSYFSASTAINLEKLPDTFILVGSIDLFLDEDINFAHRLIQSGVSTELHVIPGVFHCFDMMYPDTPQTRDYKDMRFKAIERMINK